MPLTTDRAVWEPEVADHPQRSGWVGEGDMTATSTTAQRAADRVGIDMKKGMGLIGVVVTAAVLAILATLYIVTALS